MTAYGAARATLRVLPRIRRRGRCREVVDAPALDLLRGGALGPRGRQDPLPGRDLVPLRRRGLRAAGEGCTAVVGVGRSPRLRHRLWSSAESNGQSLMPFPSSQRVGAATRSASAQPAYGTERHSVSPPPCVAGASAKCRQYTISNAIGGYRQLIRIKQTNKQANTTEPRLDRPLNSLRLHRLSVASFAPMMYDHQPCGVRVVCTM